LSVTLTIKTYITEKASSIFSAADILSYYEKNAYFNTNDRKLINEKGFQEWLLAASFIQKVETAALEYRSNIYMPFSERYFTDIVILIANLIGGAMNESV